MKESFKEKLKKVFRVKDTPHNIALSFSVGLFYALSPFLGLHIILGIVTAWIFRLNKIVTIAGVLTTNPFTLVPIYTFSTWLGAEMLGIDLRLSDINIDFNGLDSLFVLQNYANLFTGLKGMMWPFLVGSTFISFVTAVPVYFIVRGAVTKWQRRRKAHRPSGEGKVGGDTGSVQSEQ